jgi:hypothetical protein
MPAGLLLLVSKALLRQSSGLEGFGLGKSGWR